MPTVSFAGWIAFEDKQSSFDLLVTSDSNQNMSSAVLIN